MRGSQVLLRTELVEAPNVLDNLVHSCPRGADLVGCHGLTNQKHLECQKHLDLRQPIWFEYLIKKLVVQS
jgi:hypothetical protein